MVIKSLTITEDAYDALKRMKTGDESFSEVILRVSQDKIGAAAKFLGAWKSTKKEIVDKKKLMNQWRKEFEEEFISRQKSMKEQRNDSS